ncbi:calmodulin-binding receptor kinase CaMRLK-like [Miscanthus floridulus]|uniref:calmodulin-binding receptor kinase CaMRLK-like n=1 Tax=Miscanthus floridulus TaxID=154761 RepID=UPI0034578496
MPLHVHLLLLLLFATSLPSSVNSSSCAGRDDAAIVAAAFRYVRNFRAPRAKAACQPVRELHLPSRNLTGAVSWAALANLTALAALDLSGNALQGAIPGRFWRAPSLRAVDVSRNQLGGALRVEEPNPRLRSLNVSGNRFTGVDGVEGLSGLVALDVSANRIRAVPRGLRRLARVKRLDLSSNAMQGRFPGDLPPLGGVRSLNVSYNRFSGVVDPGAVAKFGHSAFVHAGNASSLVFSDNSTAAPRRPRPSSPPGPSPLGKSKKKGGSGTTTTRRRHLSIVAVAVICGVASLAMLLCLVGCVACGALRCRRRQKGGKDDEEKKEKAQWSEKGDEEEDVVVVAARGASSAAPVVLFERPLIQLTLGDLAAATSGFGRESQLAERGGRSGAAYRAVLPGDLHVVVRVVEGAVAGLREDDDNPAAAATAFRELARLRHPNILPLLGYCIAGKEKLLLYEYMEKGDLHRWLHELPAGRPDMDDTAGSGDIWEAAEVKRSISDWPTRHRIALGVARGLAFLHQGWAGGGGSAVVHGHLVPTNVLLCDDLEPRISDFFGHNHNGNATPEGDVYGFGVLVLELMTGQAGWDEASVSWARGIIRDGKGLDIVDPRVRDEAAAGAEAEAADREMVECLRVGYLCTAHSPDKRPTMQQVVGVLKDIRAVPPTTPRPGS